MDKNILAFKSRQFALNIIALYQSLIAEHGEFVLATQILRCGTAVGARAREALRVYPGADPASAYTAMLKLADETDYWLDLLHETGYIQDDLYRALHEDCTDLIIDLIPEKARRKTPS